MRVCSETGCPQLVPLGTRRCPEHARAVEKRRGSRQERGYDAAHDRERAKWQKLLDAGDPVRCRNPWCKTPGKRVDPKHFDLGHHPDRSGWRGPEHPSCNRSEGGRAAH